MREEELDKRRISRSTPASTFQNLFDNRIDRMPGKRERIQIVINADVENWKGKTRMITHKTYGPFRTPLVDSLCIPSQKVDSLFNMYVSSCTLIWISCILIKCLLVY